MNARAREHRIFTPNLLLFFFSSNNNNNNDELDANCAFNQFSFFKQFEISAEIDMTQLHFFI